MRGSRPLAAIFAVLLALLLAHGAGPAYGQAEFRAFWADAFNSGFRTAAQIDVLISRAVTGHYNAIIPEVLAYLDNNGDGQGAYWNSALVPKCAQISPPDFDPLMYLCAQAHANGIEVHAWIYTYRATRAWPPVGNTTLLAHPEWVMVSSTLVDQGPKVLASGQYWLDFGSPDVQDYIVSIVRELVTNYPIDGIHWDQEIPTTDCGYPSSMGYANSGLARFQRIYGRPGVPINTDADWQNFRRRTVDELVRRCQAEIEAIKTNPRQPLRHTAAVGVSGDAPPTCDFRSASSYLRYMNWPLWLQTGWLDAAIPMNYKREQCSSQGTWFRNWVNRIMTCWRYSRHVYMGQAIYLNTFADSIVQANYSRSRGCEGIVTYSYTATRHDPADPQGVCGTASLADPTWYDYVTANLFTSVVPTPTMPWRNPATATEGIVWGRLTDGGTGLPVDDVKVDIIGPMPGLACGAAPVQTIQTDGNGYYALTMVPAVAQGTAYLLCVTKAGYAGASVSAVCLPGDITRYDLALYVDSDGDGVPNIVDACPNTIPGSPVDAQGCPPVIPGDLERDGDVDTDDASLWESCASGPGVPRRATQLCQQADMDNDSDVDQADFAAFQRCCRGEDIPADPNCG